MTNQLTIYKSQDGLINLEIPLINNSVWLTQDEISLLFGTQRPAITKHLKNIFQTEELQENSVSSILERTAADGKIYNTKIYNLDAIISIGYRINSTRATQFRIWATNVLKAHLLKGFTVNQDTIGDTKQLIQLIQDLTLNLKSEINKNSQITTEHGIQINRIRDILSRIPKDL